MYIAERLLALREIEIERINMKKHSAMLSAAKDNAEETRELYVAIEQSRAAIADLTSIIPISHDKLNRTLVDHAIRGAILHCAYEHKTTKSIMYLFKYASKKDRLRIFAECRLSQIIHKWANQVISLDKSGRLREVAADAKADFDWCMGKRDESLIFENCAYCSQCNHDTIKRMLLKIKEDMILFDTLQVLERWDRGEMREAL